MLNRLPDRLRPALLALTITMSMQVGASAEQGRPLDNRGDAADVQSEFGGRGSCAQAQQRFSRLMQGRLADRFSGPAPDLKDLAYGDHARQRLDVFRTSAGSGPAPVIVMVHGGGWCVGDKSLANVTRAKQAHWSAKGFVFVSVNYPMISDGSRALQQAESVARALAFVQQHASQWGGDPQRVILMGHSAGAHLVSLVHADARMRQAHGVRPVLGTVSLDSGATNVVRQMSLSIPAMKDRYLEAFGGDAQGWERVSPFHQLDRSAAPWLGVCSSLRSDDSCGQARQFADKSNALGVRAEVLPVARKHGAINKDLGDDRGYTADVDRFLATLDAQVQARLNRGS